MKRILLILAIVGLLFSVGCSKEFLAHDTVYKTNDHMFYSWFGYEDPDENIQEVQRSQGGWWGDTYDMDGNKVE